MFLNLIFGLVKNKIICFFTDKYSPWQAVLKKYYFHSFFSDFSDFEHGAVLFTALLRFIK